MTTAELETGNELAAAELWTTELDTGAELAIADDGTAEELAMYDAMAEDTLE